jgi:myo-inositol-1(or 4)-monophosphatase/deoxyribonuclease-2
VPLLIDMDHEDPALPSVAVVRAAGAEDDVEWCGTSPAMLRVRGALPEAVIHQAWYTAEPPSPADLAELAPAFVNAQHLLVGPAFLDAVHAAGARAACWTVDDPSQAAHLVALGVDSLTSNDLLAVRGTAGDETSRRLAIVEELARHGAEIVARSRREGIGAVDTKASPADHVTEVDRGVERWVRAVIGVQFPEHDMVGEEYGGSSSGGRPCWYLDPVDGTANLANGVPWTSLSLALVEGGRPVVGAVLDPVGGVPIVAAEGRGSWRAGERLAILDPGGADPLSGRIVTTELAGAEPWTGFVPLLEQLAERHCTMRVPGSGTATLAGVALGRGVAAMVHRYNPIDHAAAILVVSEAGGAVLDETGSPTLAPPAAPVFTGTPSAARALAAAYAASRIV